MRILGIFRNGHRSEEHWREQALYMAGGALSGLTESPEKTVAVLERAEAYLAFIQTGKALPPL